MCDITFMLQENKRCNVRCAVLPIKDNKVLLVRNPDGRYTSLVGGRVKFGEPSQKSICREIEEELGVKVDQKRLKLRYVCENFYPYGKMQTYEILFVYSFDFDERKDFDERPIRDQKQCITFWLDLDKLKDQNVKPNFIKKFYKNKPFEFVTQIDN